MPTALAAIVSSRTAFNARPKGKPISRASTISVTASQPSTQGRLVSSGTPVKVRAPRVKSRR